MAAKGSSQKNRTNSPMTTKNGKARLGPLNVAQLTEMLSKASKPKEKAKVQRRLTELTSRPGYQAPVVVDTAVESAV